MKEHTLYERLQKPEPLKKPRKARSDKGQHQLTERDLIVLRWVGEQYAARLDQVQQLLARHSDRELVEEGRLRPQTATKVLKRWETLNLAESKKVFHHLPRWVWVSNKGMLQLELDYRYWRLNPTQLNHIYWVNQVRLYCELTYGDSMTWTSERALRRASEAPHLVDAEVELERGVVGIEVELTRKKLATVQGIVEQLERDYQTIWYFTTETTRPLVQAAIAGLPDKAQKRFRLFSLEKVQT